MHKNFVCLYMLGGRTVHTMVEQGSSTFHFFYCRTFHGMIALSTWYVTRQVDSQTIGFKKTVFVDVFNINIG